MLRACVSGWWVSRARLAVVLGLTSGGALLFTLASCGSEVIASGGGGSAAGGAGQTAEGTTGGGGCSIADQLCERFPAGDEHCAKYVDASLVDYGCVGIRAVNAACVYATLGGVPCGNCADWCCPPQPWTGPTYAALDAGPDADAPAPDGCERQPADDYACLAQGKPPYAVHCPGLDLTTMPPGCHGNPYGADGCAGASQGFFCCPAP